MQDLAGLQQDYAALKEKLSAQDSQIDAMAIYIKQLEEALILARQYRFSPSSEKGSAKQLLLFNEAEAIDSGSDEPGAVCEEDDLAANEEADECIEIPAHSRKKQSRKPLPDHLPRVDVIHDLAEAEKVCAEHQVTLVQAGEKVTEKLDIIPATVQVVRHIRKQYTCPCCENGMVTARRPNDPIPKSKASPKTLATIATYKYADGLPLYRQVTMLKRLDIDLDRTTLAHWMIKAGMLVQPLINLIRDQLFTEKIIHVDETRVQVLKEPGKSAESQSYMWVQGSPGSSNRPVILFDYDSSRSGSVPKRLLQGYQGALMVDGYEGYDAVCRSQNLTRLGCMAHARRKFVEAGKAMGKNKSAKSDYALKLIGKLYKVERDTKGYTDQERHDYRQRHAQSIVDKLYQWTMTTLPNTPPKLALGKALGYLKNQWPRLTRYLEDGAYPLDNNRVENAIRPFVIGRKGWMFSTSVDGAKASANLYSLVETAKANEVNTYAYLAKVFEQLPNCASVEDIEALLPWSIKLDS